MPLLSVSQDLTCLVSSLEQVWPVSDLSALHSLSDAEALALFQAKLSSSQQLPTPIVNFDEDALISSFIQEKPSSTLGGKLKKLKAKRGKKKLSDSLALN